MISKYGKYYADWFDSGGKRKRKAFRSKAAAEKYQGKMRRKNAHHENPPSPRTPSPKRGRTHHRKAGR